MIIYIYVMIIYICNDYIYVMITYNDYIFIQPILKCRLYTMYIK